MELIDVTPGLAPALLLSDRLPILVRAGAFVLASGFTAGIAFIVMRLTRRREQSGS